MIVRKTRTASRKFVSCHMLGRLLNMLVCVSDFSTSFSSLTPAFASLRARDDLFCDKDNGDKVGTCEVEFTSRSSSRAGSTCDRDQDCK